MENNEILLLVLCGFILLVGIISMIFDKRIRAAYNGAVGLVSGLIFSSGEIVVIAAFVALVTDIAEGESFGKMLANFVVYLLVGGAMTGGVMLYLRKRIPEGKKGIGGLILGLSVVGIAAWFRISLKMFKWIMKLVFHMNFGSGESGSFQYANYYYSNGGAQYQLWTTNGNYALLKDEGGNTFSVHPHNEAEGIVADDSGNIYYPQ